MPEFSDGYIDIRLHLTLEHDQWVDIDGTIRDNRFMVEASPEVIGFHGLEEHELQDIGNSLTQMDSHQEMLANDIPNEIYNYADEDDNE